MEFLNTLKDVLTRNITLGSREFDFSIISLMTRILLPLFAMILVYKVLNWGIRKIFNLTKFTDETKKKSLRYIRTGSRILLIGGFVSLSSSLLGTQFNYWISRFFSILREPFFESGKTNISIITLLLLIPVFSISSWAGKYSRKLVDSSLLGQFGMDESRRSSFSNLTRYVIMTIVFLFGMSMVGIDLSALGVMLGVLGIGLGFGLQGIVSNFFAGLVIISSGPVKEGDRILVNGYDGIVQSIRFISTDIKTFQNEHIILPNSYFVDNAVHNYSYKKDKKVVIVNEVAVSYNSDLEKAKAVLEGINAQNPFRVNGSENIVRILSFGDSGINMVLRTLVKDLINRADALSWTNMEIWRRFKEQGIEIPFPQRVVHLQPPKDPGDYDFKDKELESGTSGTKLPGK